MSKNTVVRTKIGLFVFSVALATSLTGFAQWGENANPYNNCPCVPARQYWGYYQTRWHRWPCAAYSSDMQGQTPRTEGIGPSQIELPPPKTEAESKTAPQGIAAPARPAEMPPQTAPPSAPDAAPSNPFLQGAPSNPTTEPAAPEKAPEKNEPGTKEPGMEVPSTEPPASEAPSTPSGTNEPAPSESPSLPPQESNETKPKEQPAMEPESGTPSGTNSGAHNMTPELKLRRGDGNGLSLRDTDPAPVMPAACTTVPSQTNSLKAARQETSSQKPELIAPAANARPLVRDGGSHVGDGNPLRAVAAASTNCASVEVKETCAVRQLVDDGTGNVARANPLR